MSAESLARGLSYAVSARMERSGFKSRMDPVLMIRLHGHRMAGISFSVPYEEEKASYILLQARE